MNGKKMDEELKKRLDRIEERLAKLEGESIVAAKADKPVNASYTGLAGGLRLLLDNGFFNEPKTVDAIIEELNREGYYNTPAGVSSTLSMTFVKSQKTLTRLKEGRKWAYVKRK